LKVYAKQRGAAIIPSEYAGHLFEEQQDNH